MTKILGPVLLGLGVVACFSGESTSDARDKTGPGNTSDVLVEAHRIHLEAMKLYGETHRLYKKQKAAAKAKADSLLLMRLDSIHTLLHYWEDGMIEVPGFAHAHEGHSEEGHKHHTPAPKMTDQSHLEFQKEAQKAILGLYGRLQTTGNLTPKAEIE